MVQIFRWVALSGPLMHAGASEALADESIGSRGSEVQEYENRRARCAGTEALYLRRVSVVPQPVRSSSTAAAAICPDSKAPCTLECRV
jgi:hypothetical protein